MGWFLRRDRRLDQNMGNRRAEEGWCNSQATFYGCLYKNAGVVELELRSDSGKARYFGWL